MNWRIFKKEYEIFRASFRKYLKEKVIPHYDEWEEQKQEWLPDAVKGRSIRL